LLAEPEIKAGIGQPNRAPFDFFDIGIQKQRSQFRLEVKDISSYVEATGDVPTDRNLFVQALDILWTILDIQAKKLFVPEILDEPLLHLHDSRRDAVPVLWLARVSEDFVESLKEGTRFPVALGMV
jgi:hypothetical protein